MKTNLYYVLLASPTADHMYFVVEETTPEMAKELAGLEAVELDWMSKDELIDPDAETYLLEPVLIQPMTGSPGVRL